MDAFFAAVEVLDHPELAGRPVIVGGAGPRGVVASCTYEARAFGVRSAMPSVLARRLCPRAVFVDARHARYAEVSARLQEILLATTPWVEPIGLDEAFLDVSGASRLLGAPEEIAHGIRDRVRRELLLDCSIGVGGSKLVAKLASRKAKPVAARTGKEAGRGVVVVRVGEELAFLHPLPIEELWGVGPATSRRLHDLGVRTVGDLAALPVDALVRRLGAAQGAHLAARARGHDTDPVVPDRAAKSVGQEETFAHDISDRTALGRHALRMVEAVAVHLREGGMAARTVTLKVKFADFSLLTRSHTLRAPIDTAPALFAVAGALLEGVDPGPGVRLLGISVSGLQHGTGPRQLSFDLEEVWQEGQGVQPSGVQPSGVQPSGTSAADAVRLQSSWEQITSAVDAIRRRFGRDSLGTTSLIGGEGSSMPSRREAPREPPPEEE